MPKAPTTPPRLLLSRDTSRTRVKSPFRDTWGRASARVEVMSPRRSATRALEACSMGFSARARDRAPARSRARGGAWGGVGGSWATSAAGGKNTMVMLLGTLRGWRGPGG